MVPIEGLMFAPLLADAVGHQWQPPYKAANVQDLHFHQLHHTSSLDSRIWRSLKFAQPAWTQHQDNDDEPLLAW